MVWFYPVYVHVQGYMLCSQAEYIDLISPPEGVDWIHFVWFWHVLENYSAFVT